MGSNVVRFVTSNAAKVKEAQVAFSAYDIRVEPYDYEFVEIQSESQEEVLRAKVAQVPDQAPEPLLVDDSGFFLAAYPLFPGVMSKFVYHTLGYAGVLRLLPPGLDRRAHFQAVVGLRVDGAVHVFDSMREGSVSLDVRAETAPGMLFEPIFVPQGADRTMAEMTWEERLPFSYRIQALAKAAQFLADRRQRQPAEGD